MILLVIFLLMLGTATKLKTPRNISLTGDVSGSTSFDGSGNVTITTDLANVAMLTGTISGNGTETIISKNVNYPAGYNKDNCVVIAAMAHNSANSTGIISSGSLFEPSSYTTGGLPMQVILRSDEIGIKCRNVLVFDDNSTMVPSINGSFSYKIVLMKI